MIRFLDGPAAAVVLELRRAPLLLRVVQNTRSRKEESEWDALDMPDDAPKPHELVYAYLRVNEPTALHARGIGWRAMADYRFAEPQPPEEVMREPGDWQFWCEANVETVRPADPAEADVARRKAWANSQAARVTPEARLEEKRRMAGCRDASSGSTHPANVSKKRNSLDTKPAGASDFEGMQGTTPSAAAAPTINDADARVFEDLRRYNLRHPGIIAAKVLRIMRAQYVSAREIGDARTEWLGLGLNKEVSNA